MLFSILQEAHCASLGFCVFSYMLGYFSVSISPLNSDVDYMIFNVCMWFFCLCTHGGDLSLWSHQKDFCGVSTESETEKSQVRCKAWKIMVTHPSADPGSIVPHSAFETKCSLSQLCHPLITSGDPRCSHWTTVPVLATEGGREHVRGTDDLLISASLPFCRSASRCFRTVRARSMQWWCGASPWRSCWITPLSSWGCGRKPNASLQRKGNGSVAERSSVCVCVCCANMLACMHVRVRQCVCVCMRECLSVSGVCVCVWVWVCLCVHAWMCVCLWCVCVYVSKWVSMCVHAWISVCLWCVCDYVCVFVCEWVSVFVCVHAWMRVCLWCVCVCVYIQAFVHVCLWCGCACTHVYVIWWVCVHACLLVCVCVCVCVRARACIHVYGCVCGCAQPWMCVCMHSCACLCCFIHFKKYFCLACAELLLVVGHLYITPLSSRLTALHEWLAFYSAFLNIHQSGVLTALTWLVPHEIAAILVHSVYTIQPCTMSLHAKPCVQGACMFNCNLLPTLVAEWPVSFTCCCYNMRVSTESWPRRRFFLCHSCRDSNPWPLTHESGALTAELSVRCYFLILFHLIICYSFSAADIFPVFLLSRSFLS